MDTGNLTFNEIELGNRLAALSSSKMVAFAAACAERLLPAYARFSEKAALDPEDALLYRNALQMIWSQLLGKEVCRGAIEDMEQKCLVAIPSEDVAWSLGEPYAVDASATVTFAIRAWLSRDPQQAVWAARRVYEAVDSCVVQGDKVQPSAHFEEQQILTHPLIQKELARQKFDLELLEEKVAPSVESEAIKELQVRAQGEALICSSRDFI